jgi:hypothetical protein
MSDDEYRFMMLRRLPARIGRVEVCYLLKCNDHDIPILMRTGLLKPMGRPKQNGRKMFRTKEVLELSENPGWLSKITNAISEAIKDNNNARNSGGDDSEEKLAA